MASEPALAIHDCPSLARDVTSELLRIELHTLGLSRLPEMQWDVRCEDQRATVELRAVARPERPHGSSSATGARASMQVDLSRTDAAAWPRLIALAASELAAQSRTHETATHSTSVGPPAGSALQSRAPSLRLHAANFDVKTPRKPYIAALRLGFTRLGDPGAWLYGPVLRAELPIGRWARLGTDLRLQVGRSTVPEGDISWRLANAAVFGGVAWALGP